MSNSFDTTPGQLALSDEGEPSRSIAGFWRRLLAFAIDVLILWGVGRGLGLAAYDWLLKLGPRGWIVGFVMATLYLGLGNSWITGGRTIGKWIAGIEVVDRDGKHIAIARSLWRSVVLTLPYFSSGFPWESRMTYDWYGYLIALGQVEIPLGAIYLAIFNRRNRQSVHDILAQTFVVHRKTGEAVRARSTWPIHYWVLLLIGVAYSYHYVDQFTPPAPHFHPSRPNEWKQGETAIQAIQTIARTGSAGGSYFHFFNVQNESEPTFFLTAELDSRPTNPESTAARIVAAVLAALPDAKSVDKIEIEIEYGYHIGIDADWHAVKLVHTPVEWMRIASRPPVSRRKTHALHAGGQAIGGRALQWLARRDVTWAVPPDFPTAEKVSVRGEIRWSGRADARAS